MRLHAGAHLRVDLPIQEIGDLSPDLKAADFYHLHWIRRVPFSFMRPGHPGLTTASPFRIPASRSTSSHRYPVPRRSEEHTSELQSQSNLVCRLLLEKK